MKRIFYYTLVSILLKHSQSYSVHMKLPKVNVTDFNMTSHLALSHIRKICEHRDTICKVNNTRVCTMRKVNETFEYKDFENSCFLFLSNMCDFPGNEFAIVESDSCNVYLNSTRRHYEASGIAQESLDGPEAAFPNDTTWADGNTTKPGLRASSFSTYSVGLTAFDGHICPHSCPNVYAPVCVNANRVYGKYLKFFQFVNHCEADVYYCKNWLEFQPPDGDMESINSSPLGWSFCGASKYLQFSLLTQTAASMGHYGWLDGDYRYSQILEPQQRKPGYG